MSLLSNLETRLNYFGGKKQQDRMVQDKLRTLKKSLLYSYQAVTIQLENGEQYRALLNKDKEKMQSIYSILSVPFEDICLNKEINGKTSENLSPINLKTGDVFTCIDTDEKWMLYLIHSQEKAYLRSDIILCNSEITINNIHYDIHISGYDAININWLQEKNITTTAPNYDLILIMKKDENTNNFFKRYKKIFLLDKTWETQVVSRNKDENLLFISLKENYNNPYDQDTQNNQTPIKQNKIVSFCSQGEKNIKPYSTETYIIKEEYKKENGVFNIIDQHNVIIIKQQDHEKIVIQVATGKQSSFVLQYLINGTIIFEEQVIIERA